MVDETYGSNTKMRITRQTGSFSSWKEYHDEQKALTEQFNKQQQRYQEGLKLHRWEK